MFCPIKPRPGLLRSLGSGLLSGLKSSQGLARKEPLSNPFTGLFLGLSPSQVVGPAFLQCLSLGILGTLFLTELESEGTREGVWRQPRPSLGNPLHASLIRSKPQGVVQMQEVRTTQKQEYEDLKIITTLENCLPHLKGFFFLF